MDSKMKYYEIPSVQRYSLSPSEDLLRVPTVSEGGYGFDDDGPEDLHRSSGE